ncbi:MAG: DNA primase [Candidatus Muproteobacteria bacterium RBG_16_64_11]|uniref:DNA primase n=1 Tax=Candidatus Muproteobacteria bacterium RBG_16_64_11 TaxID=1817758 RepID=A0A1F6T9K0_9PROT|nr:MAG: DNA primase [Candidatus Muproteobacteria bacterium RBG_16_64_11]
MSAVNLIDRLEGVRQTGQGRWIARCPAHEDRSPSLSIRELDDGRVLIHDFAGCDPGDVLSAIGLELADLFPKPLAHSEKSTRPNHWHAAREALRTLHRESLIVAIAAENIAAGNALDAADRRLVIAAAGKIRATAEVCR